MASLSVPPRFRYMVVSVEDFFERIYYPCLEKTEGLPYAACMSEPAMMALVRRTPWSASLPGCAGPPFSPA